MPRLPVLVLLLLGACSAPPTPQQATARAVQRNCEVKAEAAADEVRRQGADAGLKTADIDTRAATARDKAFRSCLLESAL